MKSHGIPDEAVHSQLRIINKLIVTVTKICNLSLVGTEISVNLLVDGNTTQVEIENPVNETGIDQLKDLDRIIQFIRGYQYPIEAFIISQKQTSLNFPCQPGIYLI